MYGKPFQSKLLPHYEKIKTARCEGFSYQKIAALLKEEYGLKVDQSTIFSFVKARSKKRKKVISICEDKNHEPPNSSFAQMLSNSKDLKKEPKSKDDFVFDFNPDEPIY